VLAALHATKETIENRARAFLKRAEEYADGLHFKLTDAHSVVGGGSAPTSQLPTTLISVTCEQVNAVEMEEKLRRNDPPIIARIVDAQLMIDLRTVSPADEEEIVRALGRVEEKDEG
jgi:L-seryl-tRNA(Ser) seleniumtransferase